MKKWYIVINESAGRFKTAKNKKRILFLLKKYGIDFEMAKTQYPEHAIFLAEEAVKNGFDKIATIGGDGTFYEVANGILRSGLSKNISFVSIPSGGGNDFAHNFGISDNYEKSLMLLKTGEPKFIDVGKIEDIFFINAFGIGLDARVARLSRKVKFLNGVPRYMVATIKAIAELKKYRCEIISDDIHLDEIFLMISIGNTKFAGGGYMLTPNALADDGLFDISIVKNASRLRILKILPKTFSGEHIKEKEVITFRSNKIQIVSDKDLPIYTDGELPELKNKKNITVELLKNQLKILVEKG